MKKKNNILNPTEEKHDSFCFFRMNDKHKTPFI